MFAMKVSESEVAPVWCVTNVKMSAIACCLQVFRNNHITHLSLLFNYYLFKTLWKSCCGKCVVLRVNCVVFGSNNSHLVPLISAVSHEYKCTSVLANNCASKAVKCPSWSISFNLMSSESLNSCVGAVDKYTMSIASHSVTIL